MEQITLMADGPTDGPVVVLAHGAAVPMDSPFMTFFARHLAQCGARAVRFEFPYMRTQRASGQRRPPDKPATLLAEWGRVIDHLGGPEKVVIGGKSMGGRMAAMVAANCQQAGQPVRGVFCLGFPFHAAGRPDEPRLDALKTLRQPVLLLQGTRDPLGNRDEIAGYGLPDTIDIRWLEDGDHDFKPRVASGRTAQQNWDLAAGLLCDYIELISKTER